MQLIKTLVRTLTPSKAVTAATIAGLATALAQPVAMASDNTLNIYSARHYPTDDALYSGFTAATGIQINRVDADDAGILARLRAEGRNSPADVILLVDATRLWRAEQDGLFANVKSATLDSAIPATVKGAPDANGASAWFGFSSRARIVVFDKARFDAADVATYAQLAAPKLKGALCLRSGSYPYNLSLFGAYLKHEGESKTKAWLAGLVDNMARQPKGGDTDQIRAVAAGECGVAVTNSYYLARLMRSDKPEDKAVVEKIGISFPDQSGNGTHVNIAGGAVAKNAKNKANAIAFLDYLATPAAQAHFANGNNEWPLAKGASANNPALAAMAPKGFKADSLPIRDIGSQVNAVQRLLDQVNFR